MVIAWCTSLGACKGDSTSASELIPLIRLDIVPDTGAVQPGGTYAFQAVGTNQDSAQVVVYSLGWSASGGQMNAATGEWTAPADSEPTGYAIVATAGLVADTAFGLVDPSLVPIVRITIVPDTARVEPGGAFQFQAFGINENDEQVSVDAVWSASAGNMNAAVGGWTAPSSPGLYEIYATSGLLSATAYGQVADAVPPPPPGVDEPLYNAGTHTSLYYESFEAYLSTTDLRAAVSSAEQRGTVNLDATQGAIGSKSYRVDWDAGGCGQDTWTWIGTDLSPPTGRKHWFVSFYIKTTPSYPANGCGPAHKTMIFDQGYASRTVFDAWASGPEGPMIYCAGKGDQWCQGLTYHYTIDAVRPDGKTTSGLVGHLNKDSRSASPYLNNGAWHRVTMHLRRESASAAGDGTARLWVDGLLVMDYQGENPDNPAYRKTHTGSLDFWMKKVQYPTTVNGGPAVAGMKIWFDDLRIYYREP
jgi:hypothetical protein